MHINDVLTKLEKNCNKALGTDEGVELRKMDANDFAEYAIEQIEKADKEGKKRPNVAKARIRALQVAIAVAKSSFADGGHDSFDIPVFGENQTIEMSDMDSRFTALESTVSDLSNKLQAKAGDEDEEEKKKAAKEEEDEEKRKAAKEEDEEEKKKAAKEEEDEEKRRKAMSDEEKEEEDKKKAAKEEEDEEKRKAKEKDDEEKVGKAASVGWPPDMNSSAGRLAKSEQELCDWGSDPAA